MEIVTVTLSTVVFEGLGNWVLLTRHASLPTEENLVPVKKMNEHTRRHKHKTYTKTQLRTNNTLIFWILSAPVE